MNRKISRPLTVLVALAMSISLALAGCSKSNNNPSPSASSESASPSAVASPSALASVDPNEPAWKKDTSPFTFTQYFYGTWATNYLWKDQYAAKLTTDKTGVKIDRFLATGNDDEYLNTMIASGDLPDSIMLDWGNPAVSKLIKNDLVFSLNELIDQYAPKMWDVLDKEMVQYHSVDGKLHYVPNFYETKDRLESEIPPIGIRPWFIRKDIYAALGNPKIETPDDLMNVLKQAKEKYPDVTPVGLEVFDVNANGLKGSRSMDYLIYSFSPNLDQERLKADQQKIEIPMRNAGFKEAFRFLNKLSQAGLFDPQLLIYKQEQYEEKLYGANYAVPSQYMDNIYRMFNPKITSTIGADKTYQALDGLKVNGQAPRYPVSRLLGWQGFFITKKAKNPERIIKFLEYALSDEGQMDFRYGKEGETYDMINGSPVRKKEIEDLSKNDNAAYNAQYGFDDTTLMWRSGKLWDSAGNKTFIENYPDQFAAMKMLASYNFDNYAMDFNVIEPEGSTPEGIINGKIKDLWNKTIPKLVLAKSDAAFDDAYNTFLGQMDQVGAEKVEKAMYQKHLVDLKKKGL